MATKEPSIRVSARCKTIQPTHTKKFVTRKRMVTKEPSMSVSARCKKIKTIHTMKCVTRESVSFLTRSSPSG